MTGAGDGVGREVEFDLLTGPWTADIFAAAILAHGPIRVPAAAVEAVRRQNMRLTMYQEWDEATQTMTYTLPEVGSDA